MTADGQDQIKRFPRVLRLLHWGMALLVLCQFGLILVLHNLKSLDFGKTVLDLHRQFGTAVLLLILVRVALMPFVRSPRSDRRMPGWQKAAALFVHALLMAALVAQPVLGMVTAWARGDDVTLFHLVKLPVLLQLSNDQGVVCEGWHKYLAFGMMGLLALHLGAVAFNHLFRRVPVLERMLAAPRTDRMTNRVPVLVQLGLCCAAILSLALGAGLYGAKKYTEFNALHTAFDEREGAALDSLRSAQLAAHSLGSTAAPDAVKAVATSLTSALPTITDKGVRQDARTAARAFAAGDAAQGMKALDSATDNMTMVVFQKKLDLTEIASQGHDLIILTLAPTVFISAVIAFLLSRSILQALAQARAMVRSVGVADTEENELEVIGHGEFAGLMRDIVGMRQTIQQRERERHELETDFTRQHAERQAVVVASVADGMRALVDGNLTFRLDTPFDEASEPIRVNFNATMDALEGVMTTIVGSSATINSESRSVAAAAASLSHRTDRQAQGLNETVTAMRRLADDLGASADHARQAAESVGTAREIADGSREVVKETVASMASLEKYAHQIEEVVEAIDNIAFQTNILALNAGVEAARAGPAGAGFAIVAQEVRALAGRAAESSKSVRELIGHSTSHIKSGVKLVGKTSAALQQIIEEVGNVTGIVQDMADVVRHQADQVARINGVINEIDQDVQKNAQMAEETTATLQLVCRQSSTLDELVKHFDVSEATAADDDETAADRRAA